MRYEWKNLYKKNHLQEIQCKSNVRNLFSKDLMLVTKQSTDEKMSINNKHGGNVFYQLVLTFIFLSLIFENRQYMYSTQIREVSFYFLLLKSGLNPTEGRVDCFIL